MFLQHLKQALILRIRLHPERLPSRLGGASDRRLGAGGKECIEWIGIFVVLELPRVDNCEVGVGEVAAERIATEEKSKRVGDWAVFGWFRDWIGAVMHLELVERFRHFEEMCRAVTELRKFRCVCVSSFAGVEITDFVLEYGFDVMDWSREFGLIFRRMRECCFVVQMV
jgi:hypothetical protein